MEKFNISTLLAQEPHKVIFAERDVSVAGVSAAQAQLSYVLSENVDCKHLRMDLFLAQGDLSTNAPFQFFVPLQLSNLATDDHAAIKGEINKFLNKVQITLLFNVHQADSFLDEEYEHLETIYPDFDIMDMETNIEKFQDQPFKVIESVDTTTQTAFDLINETMYSMTDILIAKDLFQAVQKINPAAELSAFTQNAQLPII